MNDDTTHIVMLYGFKIDYIIETDNETKDFKSDEFYDSPLYVFRYSTYNYIGIPIYINNIYEDFSDFEFLPQNINEIKNRLYDLITSNGFNEIITYKDKPKIYMIKI